LALELLRAGMGPRRAHEVEFRWQAPCLVIGNPALRGIKL
jgi:hypothetical protein